MAASIQIFPVNGLPEITAGADLAALIAAAVGQSDMVLRDGDILVVAQKVVSKSEGRVVALAGVTPSARAAAWAREYGKDPRVIELVLGESQDILVMQRGVIISRTRHGYVCANAGVDVSNAPAGTAILLPEDCDASARRLQERLAGAFRLHLGLIVADTFGRPWREGIVNVALGVAGIPALTDYRGQKDSQGKTMSATLVAVADEIACAAELVMGKTDHVPVAVVRGVTLQGGTGSGRDLIRPLENDLFSSVR